MGSLLRGLLGTDNEDEDERSSPPKVPRRKHREAESDTSEEEDDLPLIAYILARHLYKENLQEILDELELPRGGSKADLIERILESDEFSPDMAFQYIDKQELVELCEDLEIRSSGTRDDILRRLQAEIEKEEESREEARTKKPRQPTAQAPTPARSSGGAPSFESREHAILRANNFERAMKFEAAADEYAKIGLEDERRRILLYWAGTLEEGGEYEKAAERFESVGMWDEAGRVRRKAMTKPSPQPSAPPTPYAPGAPQQYPAVHYINNYYQGDNVAAKSESNVDNRGAVMNRSSIGLGAEQPRAGSTCPSCGGVIQPHFKACPSCGTALRT